MAFTTRQFGAPAITALLGALAGCANGNPAPPSSSGAGAGSASGEVPAETCPEGAAQACYSGPAGTLGVAQCKGGERRCEGDAWSPCEGEVPPAFELCNGLDDDCDGVADNGNPGAGNTCATGDKGLCGLGTSMCKEGVLQCIAFSTPTAEVCDTIDNDCDGEVDEQVAESGKACATGVPGACSAGAFVCAGGALVCKPSGVPSLEACNGIDDDCDGVVDNDVSDVGQACSTGLKGACAAGKTACLMGQVKCMSPEAMAEETCDGVDQNCDGIQDDDVCATAHLEASADATVYEYDADENYGSGTDLVVETEFSEVFVRFDLKSVPGNVKVLSVRLEMMAFSGYTYGGDGAVYTHLVPNDTWGEHGITWNNKPPADDKALGSWLLWYDGQESDKLGVNADPLLIDPVQSALDSDKLISFRLYSPENLTIYRSREWGNAAQRPRLVVQYADKP
jgi:hypothetical protein